MTSGIVCFCGERFSEAQALEFMLHLRAEVGETMSWAENKRSLKRESSRRARANPESNKRQLDRMRNWRLRQDPEYRQRERERQRIRRQDPEYRERVNAKARAARARKKAEREAISPAP